jgi:hypothetical protein
MEGQNPKQLRKEKYMTVTERATQRFIKLWEAANKAADSALMAQKKDGLICGIAYSIGLLNTNYYECAAECLLNESGIKSKSELRAAGCDQLDINNIGNLLPEEADHD